MAKPNRSFAGEWRIVEMPDMSDGYMQEGRGKSVIRLKAVFEDQVSGEYQCGLSSGGIDGAVRMIGGDILVIFGHDSMDEMDLSSGGGWMRLREDGWLEGEFVNGLGRFTARKKVAARSKAVKAGRK